MPASLPNQARHTPPSHVILNIPSNFIDQTSIRSKLLDCWIRAIHNFENLPTEEKTVNTRAPVSQVCTVSTEALARRNPPGAAKVDPTPGLTCHSESDLTRPRGSFNNCGWNFLNYDVAASHTCPKVPTTIVNNCGFNNCAGKAYQRLRCILPARGQAAGATG